MKTCPECLRDLYHWHCACGYRAPRLRLAAVPGPESCPECRRSLSGDRCACGYRKPSVAATPLEVPPLTPEARERGTRTVRGLIDRLKAGNYHLSETRGDP